MKADLAPRLDVSALITKAMDGPNLTVEILERLFQLAKEVRAENARAAWHQAMAAFQADVPDIPKNKVAKVRTRGGAEYKYQYAALDSVISVVRPKLSKHGLSVTFEILMDGGSVTAACIVAHEEGHAQTTAFTIPIDLESHMNPAQQVASASTYARRYAYMAALGLAPDEDDDGAATVDPPAEPRPKAYQPPVRHAKAAPEPARPAPLATAPPANPSYDVAKNTPELKVEPVREFEGDDGRPIWVGTLLGHREVNGTQTSGKRYTMHVFKGQDGKEAVTFDSKMALALLEKLRERVELTWEPGGTRKDRRDIVGWKSV